MKFSKLEGLKVFSSDAALVGEIVGADVDTKKWDLTYIHIELADDAVTKLGYKKHILGHITINLPSGYVKTVGDMVTLDRTLPELKKVPPSKEACFNAKKGNYSPPSGLPEPELTHAHWHKLNPVTHTDVVQTRKITRNRDGGLPL